MGTDNHDSFTLADVLREGFEDYIRQYGPLPAQQYKVAHAIMRCRTEEMGGHLYQCEECGYEITLYNSCRNRHCPTCQAYARLQWVQERIKEALPVPYFHVVFTLPQQVRDFALRNRAAMYGILFRAVTATLKELGADTKRLGGMTGLIAVLHTWTQTLDFHPHLHCIVPGGALSPDKKSWIRVKGNFLFPVPVMRKMFKGKFMDMFCRAVTSGEIGLHGALSMYENPAILEQLVRSLHDKDWVVYAKPPFATPDNLIKYLGAYTHRVAISNNRIVNVENGMVTFRYKDRRDNDRTKCMTLRIVEFIRRFMTHVVPDGFMRMRHYGFLSNKNRAELVPLCKRLLYDGQNGHREANISDKTLEALTGEDRRVCPHCKQGRLQMKERIEPLMPFRLAA